MSNEATGSRVVLVTGATGFLGRAVVGRLSSEWRVRCASRDGTIVDGGSEHVRIDLATGEGLADACRGVAAVVHCAGLAHQFQPNRTTPFHTVNALGTGRLVAAAVAQGVPRVVIASSISVYGNVTGGRSEDTPCEPETDYARSKLAGEQAAIQAAAGTSTTVIILRLATLFGTGDPGNVARLADAIRRRRFIPIGDGRNRKSLLHCSDAADAMALALEWRAAPAAAVVFNVSAPPVEMREVVSAITAALERRPYRWFVPSWPVRFAQRLWKALGGQGSPLGAVEKFLSEDVVDTARFHAATGFLPRRQLSDRLYPGGGMH